MPARVFRFWSFFFTSVCLMFGGAHLLELPNKMQLSREAYLTAQQLYRGWNLAAFAVIGAVVCTLVATILLRRDKKAFRLTLAALLCLAATQVIFWVFTYPMNILTEYWTTLPENWASTRAQWEYSHAASALLDFAAVIALFVARSAENGLKMLENAAEAPPVEAAHRAPSA